MTKDKSEFLHFTNRQPFDLPERLSNSVDELGLRDAVNSMEEEGYCVIPEIADPEFTAQLREISCGLMRDIKGSFNGLSAPLLLGRHPIFEELLLNPKVQAIAEVICGKGALLSQYIAVSRPKGSPALPLHSDQNWIPAPFAKHTQVVTMCWTMDDYTEEGGCTRVVPGSHKLRRPPTKEECQEGKGEIPIICPPNSLAIWGGAVWHGNYARVIPGERVTIHLSFCRLHVRPVESYDHLGKEWLADRPDEFKVMLGREDFLGSATIEGGGIDFKKTLKTAEWVKE